MAYELASKTLVLGLVLSAVASSTWPEKSVVRRVPMVYVLGDSTLDVGNNNYLPGENVPRANRPYHGIDMPGFGKPIGRFSNGYNTADFVAMSMGFQSSPPPYLSLESSPGRLVLAALATDVSYASSGAGILDSTVSLLSLSRQVDYFGATRSKMVASIGSDAVRTLLSRSVFLIGVGGNDLSAFTNAEQASNRSAADQQSDVNAFYDSLLSNYSAAITELYTLGARKLAIINVGLAGCLPFARGLDGACSDHRNELAACFNSALRSLLASLAARLPGLVYSLVDSYGIMAAIFAHPQATGFTDVASGCCGGAEGCLPTSTLCANRDEYYFWDGIHPSQRAASIRVQAFYDGATQYTTPINFKQLVQIPQE